MTSHDVDAEEVLRQRARELARPRDEPAQVASIEVLEIRLAQECYAIETRYVLEVFRLRDLTPLPGTPPFLRGVLSLRGRIVPVIDIKKFFDLPDAGLTDLHRVVLVRAADVEVGLLADTVAGVHSMPLDLIHASPPTTPGIGADYLLGVTAARLIVLDIARMLADPKLIVRDDESNVSSASST